MIALIPRERPRQGAAVTGTGGMVRQARMHNYRRLVAQVTSGSLKVYRYNDSNPDTIQYTDTLVATGVTGCSLGVRPCAAVDLFYVQSGVLKHALTRDCGASWAYASIGGTGYSHVAHCLGGSLLLQARLKAGTWYCAVGSLDANGNTWSFTGEQSIGAGDDVPGTLSRLSDGSWRLTCMLSNNPVVYTCRGIDPATAAGTWQQAAVTGITGYRQVDRAESGMQHVLPVYNAASSTWYGVANGWDTAGSPTYSLGSAMTTGRNAGADLRREADGSWHFVYVPADSHTPVVKRSRNLSVAAAGDWN